MHYFSSVLYILVSATKETESLIMYCAAHRLVLHKINYK